LIRNNELSREEALNILSNSNYPGDFDKDIEYFCKKLDFSQEEFVKILNEKPKSHLEFDNSEKIFQFSKKVFKIFYQTK